jgi:hypothetical protein
MRLQSLITSLLLLSSSTLVSATGYVVPTTTLTAQTSNNTSAASGFSNQTNGNRGAGNTSKVAVQSLLYSGATTKVYAHLLLWFGESKHMNVGYSSTDAAQIKRQVEDMISRGIDGVIIDWYGPNNDIDQATQLVMAEAENHPGFTFAIMVDQGAIEWDSCQGCTPQQALIAQLQYIEQKYVPSSAYMTEQGQPVITNFNVDLEYTIDWNAVNAALSIAPFYIFQNNNGFGHTLSKGSYAWVMPTTTDYGMGYLTSFYDTGMGFPSEQTVGATYKGFNDTLASWGSDRIMGQQCGQTWLQTFSKANSLYSSGKQLSQMQLVTWNDYEEGTEIETGIDNCFTVAAAAKSNSLNWAITGNESTVDHYTTYISTDGQNLMPLTDLATGIYSLNLCSFPIPAGNYTLFVQAIGKPSMANQMSGGVAYTPSCAPPPSPSTVSLSASPSSIDIPGGQSGNLTVTATPEQGAYNDAVAFSCAGLPSGWSCSFSPSEVTPGANPATSSLTISNVAGTGMNAWPDDLPQGQKSLPIYAGLALPFGIAGLALTGSAQRRRGGRALALCVVVGLGLIASSCGGLASKSTATVTPTSYSVTINGSSGSSQFSTSVNVTIQ